MGFPTLKVTLTNCYQNVLLFLTFNSQFHQILCTIPDSAYILNLSQISAPFPILQPINFMITVSVILGQTKNFQMFTPASFPVILNWWWWFWSWWSCWSGQDKIEQDGTGQKFHLNLTSQVNLWLAAFAILTISFWTLPYGSMLLKNMCNQPLNWTFGI